MKGQGKYGGDIKSTRNELMVSSVLVQVVLMMSENYFGDNSSSGN